MDLQQQIIRFWFGENPAALPPAERMRFWFGGGPATDQAISDQFAEAVARAAAGDYAEWAKTPAGTLALLLLLDQFTRNIYRNSPKAYAWDSQALALTEAGLANRQDLELALVQRAFFYLPLEHSECLEHQQRSVQLFKSLLAEAPPEFKSLCESFLDYAIRHRDIIARFGRFPHRNATLGRPSTAEEATFLTQPGSSF